MKKVFSLICLFIFMFFGVVNTVFAADNGKEVLSIDNVKTRLMTFDMSKPSFFFLTIIPQFETDPLPYI